MVSFSSDFPICPFGWRQSDNQLSNIYICFDSPKDPGDKNRALGLLESSNTTNQMVELLKVGIYDIQPSIE